MQVFYLSNINRENTGFEKIKKIFVEYENIAHTPGFQIKMFFKNHHLSYYSANGNFIANNGVFIYKDRFNKQAIRKFYEDLNSGGALKDLLLKAHGQFFLVLYFEGKLMVVTDRFRTIPIYLLNSKNVVEVSNVFYLLTQNSKVNYSVNFDYLSRQLSSRSSGMRFTYVFPEGTLFKEISYLKSGCIYSFVNNEIKIEEYYNIKEDIEFGKYRTLKQVVDKLTDILDSNYRFLDNIEKIFCGITGGIDTRLNLSTLLEKNKQFLCGNAVMEHENYLKNGKYSDLRIVGKVLSKFKLNYRNVCDNTEDVMKWKQENYETLKSIMSGWATLHRHYYYDFVSKIADVELTGLGGTELINKDSHFYFRKKKDFNIEEYIKKQRYNDILSDRYYSRERYYDSLRTYVRDLTSDICYSKRGDLLTYLVYISGYMNDVNNDYFGTMNLFCPVYSPFLEPDFLKVMMETPYNLKGFHSIQRHLYARIVDKKLRDIDTTHGYPPTLITATNFYRFLRLFNPIEPSLQYYPLIKRAGKGIYSFIMGRALPCLYRWLKPLKLDNKIKLGCIEAFINIIEDSNPINRYIDKNKLQKRIMDIELRSTIKAFSERMRVYLEK